MMTIVKVGSFYDENIGICKHSSFYYWIVLKLKLATISMQFHDGMWMDFDGTWMDFSKSIQ